MRRKRNIRRICDFFLFTVAIYIIITLGPKQLSLIRDLDILPKLPLVSMFTIPFLIWIGPLIPLFSIFNGQLNYIKRIILGVFCILPILLGLVPCPIYALVVIKFPFLIAGLIASLIISFFALPGVISGYGVIDNIYLTMKKLKLIKSDTS